MEKTFIPVTKPYIPNRKILDRYIDEVWERQWFTNNGPLLQEYETQLGKALGTERPFVVGNGTIALQIALKALGITGEVITTPFSYVATTSSIVWEGMTPVFVDIDDTLNIDPKQIEASITEKTSAILATHCFGNACDIEAIDAIAKKHGLKVIYDASHCYGTTYKGESIFNFGDVSTLSLHATKLVHSIEGGAIFCSDEKVMEQIRLMRNFGHDGPEKFTGVGINGKNSEMHAAVGLTVLKDAQKILDSRKEISLKYNELLMGTDIQTPVIDPNCVSNYSYYPVVFKNEEVALQVKAKLEEENIQPRRYFYPLLSELDYVHTSNDMSRSKHVSSSILCLPIFYNMPDDVQLKIVEIVKQNS